MLSMSIHQGIKISLTSSPSLPSQNPNVGFLKTPSLFKIHKPSSSFCNSSTPLVQRFHRLSVSAAVQEAIDEETPLPAAVPDDQEDQVKLDVKSVEKPRLVLKFIWMEKNIGLGLDQVIPGHGSIPLSPYFFWPRKDAWEELKTTLESKSWISQKKMIILLNQATDIINLWQQSGGNLTS
ncbi:30S ribosomal protein 3-1, chloroplastic-like [Cynara cardunculus var. scolymus]|uniref:30S ribosomal protein 3-1, chloroplastic-like n=1 Tax=Cynara cardunculus var. scolymus TaxID=59895 RepID=UPI000D6240E4|nr:30S ribosomal protein 3-1, chloroplastic-like [Cynara cardunculus var. scolymus]